ncbi:D-glycero-beta-D-manno-heptose 1-phosphate adenylyltransferase [Chitinophaga terrae (ex Kim and Jung 2007)]|nr:D-glycero-beta-D-manno-heptose 1-phosphate adenylyltransferase [Chitinophaga terrae (ex Kim and Jung 2007)]GEP91706.1 bifunctional protein HldE [Chitinophaga terrae (ex Kim and Jung 2007)]
MMEKVIQQLYEHPQRFSVLVIGDLILDAYMKGYSNRLCPEATAPVVNIQDEKYALGGAGNIAFNLAALGANVTCMGITGKDKEAQVMQELFSDSKINTNIISCAERTTICKTRLVSGTQLLARYDKGSEGSIDDSCTKMVIRELNEIYPYFDAVILADYRKGFFNTAIIKAIEKLQKKYHPYLAVDSKKLQNYAALQPDIVKPNRKETATLLEEREEAIHASALLQHQSRLFDCTGAKVIAVTLDEDGAVILEKEKPAMVLKAERVPHPQVSGAGDTYLSAFTMAYMQCRNSIESASVASLAASIAIKKPVTAFCSIRELMFTAALNSKIIDSEETLELLSSLYRSSGKRIVFTNGCFDILHSGHVSYLEQAAGLGDVLIVGVNNDESIKRLKGPKRPVNHLADRMEVLAGLRCVTHIVPFGGLNEDNPDQLISIIQPDVFAKGGDYTIDTLPEAPLVEALGGQVEIIPIVNNTSTSNIINKISAYQLLNI